MASTLALLNKQIVEVKWSKSIEYIENKTQFHTESNLWNGVKRCIGQQVFRIVFI